MWPPDKEFLTLLPSTMLMTPAECKHWTPTSVVRMFNEGTKLSLKGTTEMLLLAGFEPQKLNQSSVATVSSPHSVLSIACLASYRQGLGPIFFFQNIGA